jgi:hypothetical protein
MISTAHPLNGPTALTVTLAGRCNVPISLNVHLTYRSSILTAGQDKRCCYLRFLPAKVKIVIPNAALWTFILILTASANSSHWNKAADYQISSSLYICMYDYVCTNIYTFIFIYSSFQERCFQDPGTKVWIILIHIYRHGLVVWFGKI